MTPEQEREFRQWAESRFDRIFDMISQKTAALQSEIVTTRHGLKPVIEQMAIQIAEHHVLINANTTEINEINLWRSDEGPLDTRLKRHSKRMDDNDAWRNRMIGAVGILSIAFIAIVGVFTQRALAG